MKLLLHFLELALLINASDDFVDVELEAHVAHLLLVTAYNLRGLDASRRIVYEGHLLVAILSQPSGPKLVVVVRATRKVVLDPSGRTEVVSFH